MNRKSKWSRQTLTKRFINSLSAVNCPGNVALRRRVGFWIRTLDRRLVSEGHILNGRLQRSRPPPFDAQGSSSLIYFASPTLEFRSSAGRSACSEISGGQI